MKVVPFALAAVAASTFASVAVADDADVGEKAYTQFCATCHGVSGAGDGPMTQMMTTGVPDLTGLTDRNDGAFPMLQVIHIIDGRSGMRAHGGPMPIYGALFDAEFEDSNTYGSVLYTRGKVLSLAYYLESIQN